MHQKIVNTKLALQKALIHLLQKKQIREITVSELCENAGINRSTFYKYYQIPQDILNEYMKEIFSRTGGSVFMNDFPGTPQQKIYQSMTSLCQMYFENREIIKVALSTDFKQSFAFDYFLNQNEGKLPPAGYKFYFISGGVSAALIRWFQEDCKRSSKEVAKELADYILSLL